MRPTLPYLVSCWIKFHNVLYFLIDFFSILTFLLSFSNLFCEMTNSIHHPQNSAVLPSISFKQLLITITYLSKNVELVVIFFYFIFFFLLEPSLYPIGVCTHNKIKCFTGKQPDSHKTSCKKEWHTDKRLIQLEIKVISRPNIVA